MENGSEELWCKKTVGEGLANGSKNYWGAGMTIPRARACQTVPQHHGDIGVGKPRVRVWRTVLKNQGGCGERKPPTRT
jgi:hypothetical protein